VKTTASKSAPAMEELVDTVKEAVAEALAEREERKERTLEEEHASRSRPPLVLMVVLVLFLASCLYNYLGMCQLRRPLEVSRAQQIEAVNVHLYGIRARLEQHFAANGFYPANLGELDIPADQTLKYILLAADEYALEYSKGDLTRYYSSKEPPGVLLSGELGRALGAGPAP
jgi:hypothetical protein